MPYIFQLLICFSLSSALPLFSTSSARTILKGPLDFVERCLASLWKINLLHWLFHQHNKPGLLNFVVCKHNGE